MANSSGAFGLRPVCYLNGAPYNGQANQYFVSAGEAASIFIGDPVRLSDVASTSVDGLPSAEVGVQSSALVGVCVGTVPVTRDSNIYREGGVNRIILVADDPNILFEVKEDSDSGVIALASIGLNCDLIAGTGSAVTGNSGWLLDSSSVATWVTCDVQIMRGVDRVDNTLASSYADWLVRLNNHQYRNATTGV